MDYYGWKRYVPVAERRRNAMREMEKRRKKGESVSPVLVEGRKIAKTFWGKSWCENLERYSDYANRLPRGRTYVRNGSVVDLQIGPGVIRASVCGTELYEVRLTVALVDRERWKSICRDCAGSIDSLVELLQGRLSNAVMERICRDKAGLFPSPSEIKLSCSCPDWAGMCKHVAAVLYGIGSRFDDQPELLFRLRGVDETELITKAGSEIPLHARTVNAGTKVLVDEDLAGMFGLDIAESSTVHAEAPAKIPAKRKKNARPKRAKVATKRTGASRPGEKRPSRRPGEPGKS